MEGKITKTEQKTEGSEQAAWRNRGENHTALDVCTLPPCCAKPPVRISSGFFSFSLIFNDLYACLCPFWGLFRAFSVGFWVVRFCCCFWGLFLVFSGFLFSVFRLFFGFFSGCFSPRPIRRNAYQQRGGKKSGRGRERGRKSR